MQQLTLRVTTTLALATLASAHPQGFDARSRAMGGVSVAASRVWSAPLNNPALLSMPKEDDDFGLLLPFVGVEARAAEEFGDDVSDFSDRFDEVDDIFNQGGQPSQEDLDGLADALLLLDGQQLLADIQTGLAISVPSESLGVGLMVRGNAAVRGALDISAADADAIRNALGDPNLPVLDSRALVRAAVRAEVGLSFARQFEMFGKRVAIGVTPKAQTIQAYNYATTVDDFDSVDDVESDDLLVEESTFNADLGAAMYAAEDLLVGLTINDVVSKDLDSVVSGDSQYGYRVRPVATAGVAWDNDWVTLAADLDLTKRQPFDVLTGSQFLSVGTELELSWVQLRAGYRMDLEEGREDVVTAGFGISPFEVVRLDVAGLMGDETYGAALQLSVTF